MPHDIEIGEFERKLQAPARKWNRPQLALRQRSNDHPLAMFAAAAAAAFLSMAFIPTAGPAFASIGKPQPAKLVEEVRTTAKGDRLIPTVVDVVCHGQAWGAENVECLTVIAVESGRKEPRAVRMIASAEPNAATPNIF